MQIKKGDILLIILLVIAALSWFGKDIFWTDQADKQAVITVDGQVYTTISLNKDNELKEILIERPGNNYVHIVSEKDMVWVESSSCPDKVCMKTGKINKPGQSIVCLPNKTIVHIESNEEPEIDDISY